MIGLLPERLDATIIRGVRGTFPDMFELLPLPGAELLDGWIEADLAVPAERSFHGVFWRRDGESYESFLHDVAFKLPGVTHVRSSVVLKEVKAETRLPLDDGPGRTAPRRRRSS